MTEYKRTVTVQRTLGHPLPTMINFVKSLGVRGKIDLKGITDDELIEAVCCFWDSQHGEDD